ncbi:MAG TPA: NCS2 family nucleobase:cation symporter [Candidatus Atopostipes pullistercoris]|uniref:NCS2 family nucleobase:cation symporter n=1 Tax=Candidatus Atopostipes pullistercoris TaxID=2838467 RepID=A0A9D2G393_9LACT|nr:NCS2 family nucleobase:cation symporter [Candidatus Atopostipes pullistercoris]
MIEEKKLLLDVDEKPQFWQGVLLSFQHIFAMFGATILVPILTGLPISVALLMSGVGTLIYHTITKSKVPVYLGSSFAFIGAMQIAMDELGGDVSASQTGIMIAGLTYVIIALISTKFGTDWIDHLLPPIVIGPMIMVIGLGLSSSAVENAGLVSDAEWRTIVVALSTFLITAFVNTKATGFLRIIPFLVGIIGGYIIALLLGVVDVTPIIEADWFSLPELYLPFKTNLFNEYHLYFGPEAWAFLPLVLVTAAEHIGDHTVLSKITERNFLKDPGLAATLTGDGVATFVSAFFGGPANTTYGENTGVIGLTRIASTSVIRNAAIIAIMLSFFGKFTALLTTIPNAVIGGMSIILYGVIASNGLKVMIDEQIDFTKVRNLIITSAMLVIGLGGAVLDLGPLVLSGTALSAIVGVILNLVLPQE